MNKINEFFQKYLIILSILMLCLALSYYLAIYLPKENHLKFVLGQQEKCHSAGQEAYKADLQAYDVTSLDDPQYAYSEKLNTCIYSSGYSYEGNPSSGTGGEFLKHNCDAYWERWVKNSYTNEKILDLYNLSDTKCQWSATTKTIEDFNTQSDELFAN